MALQTMSLAYPYIKVHHHLHKNHFLQQVVTIIQAAQWAMQSLHHCQVISRDLLWQIQHHWEDQAPQKLLLLHCHHKRHKHNLLATLVTHFHYGPQALPTLVDPKWYINKRCGLLLGGHMVMYQVVQQVFGPWKSHVHNSKSFNLFGFITRCNISKMLNWEYKYTNMLIAWCRSMLYYIHKEEIMHLIQPALSLHYPMDVDSICTCLTWVMLNLPRVNNA